MEPTREVKALVKFEGTSNPEIGQLTIAPEGTMWGTQFTLFKDDGSRLHITEGMKVYIHKLFVAKKKTRTPPSSTDPFKFALGER